MILPNKITRPIDSLFCISSIIVSIASKNELSIEDVYRELNKAYPIEISYEKYIYCIDFLYILGKVERNDEILKIRM